MTSVKVPLMNKITIMKIEEMVQVIVREGIPVTIEYDKKQMKFVIIFRDFISPMDQFIW